MTYLIVAFAAGVVITFGIARFFFIWSFDKLNWLEETERKQLTDQIKLLKSELTEAKRLLRVREDQRDEAEEMTETMGGRIDYLESENERLKGYETAVRELTRSVEILAEDVPF